MDNLTKIAQQVTDGDKGVIEVVQWVDNQSSEAKTFLKSEFVINVNNANMAVHNAYKLGYEAGLAADKWVSVEDRFPDTERWVLVLIDGKHTILPHYRVKGLGQWSEYGSPNWGENITHWRDYTDLLNPPKNQ